MRISTHYLVPSVALAAAASPGCSLDLPCYGNDECSNAQICFEGACIDPPAAVPVDVGVPDDPTQDGSIAGNFTWLREVEPLVRLRCQKCHNEPQVNGAPFPLLSYADTQVMLADGTPIYERMAARVRSESNPMPPRTEPPLSAREIDIMVAWAALGAPEGERPDGGPPDSGMFVDVGPDVGFPDTGFFDGGPMGATDPVSIVGLGGQLPGQYVALDGLVWSADRQGLYFCDVGTNLIFEYLPAASAIGPFRPNSLGASGIGIDQNGNFVVAQQEARRVARLNGADEVAIANAWMNNRFNAPNDIEVRSDGVIYFSDPPRDGVGRREMPFNGVFRLTTTGTVVPEFTGGVDSSAPNGLALSPDERLMYVSDAFNDIIRVFDVEPDGRLTNPRGFTVAAVLSGGMDTDREGNLYVASAEGIEVFAPSGFKWGTIGVAALPTNVVFGGDDLSTLFVATTETLLAYPAGIPGAARPLNRSGSVAIDAGVPRDAGTR